MLCLSDELCDPFDDRGHWAVLLKMASNDFAEIILDSDGEIRIMASHEQLKEFLETDIDEFIDL